MHGIITCMKRTVNKNNRLNGVLFFRHTRHPTNIKLLASAIFFNWTEYHMLFLEISQLNVKNWSVGVHMKVGSGAMCVNISLNNIS